MAGVLQFTLGLETADFLSKLHLTSGQILSLATVGKGLEGVYQGVAKEFERGIGLEQLSKRTGQSITSLFEIQRGFEAAGLSADNVGGALFRMQRALAGVNEFGQKTSDTFGSIGLNIAELKKMDAAGQMSAIFASLNKLNQADAAKTASRLFGRGEGANMLQLARSAQEVNEAMKSAAGEGAFFERNAAAFDRMRLMALQIKQAMQEAFSRGAMFAAGFVEAFKEGQLSEVIEDTFKLSLRSILAYSQGIFAKMGEILLRCFELPLNYVQAAMTHLLTPMQWRLQNPEQSNKMEAEIAAVKAKHKQASPVGSFWLDLFGGDATKARASEAAEANQIAQIRDRYMGKQRNFADTLKEQKERGLGFNFGGGEFGLSDIGAAADKELAAAKAAMSGRWADYSKRMQALADKLGKARPCRAARAALRASRKWARSTKRASSRRSKRWAS